MEYENSNTVLKPIATQSIGNEVIPQTPIIATASSQEGSQYHAQDFCQYSFGYIGSLDPIIIFAGFRMIKLTQLFCSHKERQQFNLL